MSHAVHAHAILTPTGRWCFGVSLSQNKAAALAAAANRRCFEAETAAWDAVEHGPGEKQITWRERATVASNGVVADVADGKLNAACKKAMTNAADHLLGLVGERDVDKPTGEALAAVSIDPAIIELDDKTSKLLKAVLRDDDPGDAPAAPESDAEVSNG